jgi:DNA-binding NtrC family response regulator
MGTSFIVLLAENDTTIARPLAVSLGTHFRSVKTVHNVDELRSAIPRMRANAIVADLETVSLADVASLRREFHLPVVCTHRIPDEHLWTAAMEAGALDVCSRLDVGSIVRAITETGEYNRATAA